MRIPRYWAKETYSSTDREGKKHAFRGLGWSFESLAAAKKSASESARRIFARLTSGKRPDSYEYLERPLREELIDSVTHDGDEIAVITRNRYGALVLNAAFVCFADVDFPAVQSHGLMDAILLAFSTKRRSQRLQAGRAATWRQVKDWATRHPEHSFRIYRTFAGLRLLFTDRLYQPTSPDVADLLRGLGSDELYRKLTEKQECFRARLTPKPWRCGCRRPPNRYPWIEDKEEEAYREWEREYEQKASRHVACRLIETVGEDASEPRVKMIVEVHDRNASGASDAELA